MQQQSLQNSLFNSIPKSVKFNSSNFIKQFVSFCHVGELFVVIQTVITCANLFPDLRFLSPITFKSVG